MSNWMANVTKTLEKQKLRLNQLYENVVSLIRLTLLGYNTSFGHIHAVNLTQDSQMQTKALRYLASAALLDSKSDLLIITINSTQRDLSSGQSTSMSPTLTVIIGYVRQALTHTIPVIRQKAVMCIHLFITKESICGNRVLPGACRK